jgi:hypothetical protein
MSSGILRKDTRPIMLLGQDHELVEALPCSMAAAPRAVRF